MAVPAPGLSAVAVTAGLGSSAERLLPPTSRRGRGVGGVVYEPMVFVSDKRNAAIESGTKPDRRVIKIVITSM